MNHINFLKYIMFAKYIWRTRHAPHNTAKVYSNWPRKGFRQVQEYLDCIQLNRNILVTDRTPQTFLKSLFFRLRRNFLFLMTNFSIFLFFAFTMYEKNSGGKTRLFTMHAVLGNDSKFFGGHGRHVFCCRFAFFCFINNAPFWAKLLKTWTIFIEVSLVDVKAFRSRSEIRGHVFWRFESVIAEEMIHRFQNMIFHQKCLYPAKNWFFLRKNVILKQFFRSSEQKMLNLMRKTNEFIRSKN